MNSILMNEFALYLEREERIKELQELIDDRLYEVDVEALAEILLNNEELV